MVFQLDLVLRLLHSFTSSRKAYLLGYLSKDTSRKLSSSFKKKPWRARGVTWLCLKPTVVFGLG